MTKIQNSKPEIRYLDDMRVVLHDKKWAERAKNAPLYYMYRGVREKNNLRYDITVIPPKMLGQEFVKTKGHEHRGPHQEIYIVLEGRAIYLMQKCQGKVVEDVLAIIAKKGDVAIMPPGYGHITINPARVELKTANWVSKKMKSDYSLFEKMSGACYYYTKLGWIKNKNYKKIPKLRFDKPLKSIPRDLRSFLERAGSSL